VESGDVLEVYTTPARFEVVKKALEASGFTPASAAITMQPTSTVNLEGTQAQTMLRLADDLEDLDDVQNVFANFDISEEEMEKFA
jgi:transcriptional/translational regulatory protein YebC/TACO1